ncbi:methionine--tRNA ligase [Candidatus Saccharibacteria bacterium]|nr:methionine--tRNA ligase [Candidatus Saccharibacteria bacterium]MDQ5969716.1 methionyl-tRNA synthetase [Patescibacteria group bacterium]
MNKPFYVTTSIPYASSAPHIGNAIDWLYADSVARYHKQMGEDVIYSAGADEHGSKIYEKALEANQKPEEYIEKIVPVIKDSHALIGSEYTHFPRTNSKQHQEAATLLWKQMGEDIYKSKYSGWYCVGCEEFKTETEVKENNETCPDHNQAYQKIEEENYFFKLSKYQKQLEDLIESNEFEVVPGNRRKEILNVIKGGLVDLSISRPKKKLPWGIAVPGDSTQVMYVWFEALMNYISLLGYPDGDEFKHFWPTNLQIVGKDNLRFHAAIYPAMLLSAKLPLLKRLFVHGHLTSGGKKMSKTIGNIVTTEQIVEKYGSDAFRYYFLRHVPSYDDGDFTWERFDAVYHGELANELGNGVQRVASMINRYQQGVIGTFENSGHDTSLYHEAVNSQQFDKALDWVWELVKSLNVYLEEQKPWQLAKEADQSHLQEVLASCVGDIMQIAELLTPFLPNTAATIQKIFKDGYVHNYSGVLFPRIEK